MFGNKRCGDRRRSAADYPVAAPPQSERRLRTPADVDRPTQPIADDHAASATNATPIMLTLQYLPYRLGNPEVAAGPRRPNKRFGFAAGIVVCGY
jgi:hypothetical protein